MRRGGHGLPVRVHDLGGQAREGGCPRRRSRELACARVVELCTLANELVRGLRRVAIELRFLSANSPTKEYSNTPASCRYHLSSLSRATRFERRTEGRRSLPLRVWSRQSGSHPPVRPSGGVRGHYTTHSPRSDPARAPAGRKTEWTPRFPNVRFQVFGDHKASRRNVEE